MLERLAIGRNLALLFGGLLALIAIAAGLAVLLGLIAPAEALLELMLASAVIAAQAAVISTMRRRLDAIDRDASSRHQNLAKLLAQSGSLVKELSRKVATLQLRAATSDPGPQPIQASEIIELEEQGKKIRFDLTPDHYLHRCIRTERRLYEHELLDFIASRFRSGLAIADVGANVGNHAVFFGAVMSAKPLLCFEASPITALHLRRNLELNRVDAIVVESALGEREDKGSLWIRFDQTANPGAVRLTLGEGEIEVTTLDAIVERERVGSLDLIKIDVEGMELDVLRGAKETIERSHPDLFLEFQTEELLALGRRWLAPFGYQQGQRFNYTPTYHFFVEDASKRRER